MKPIISFSSLSSLRKTTTLSPCRLFTFTTFIFVLFILYENHVSCFHRQTSDQVQPRPPKSNNKHSLLTKTGIKKQVTFPFAIGEPHGDENHQECDVFSGKWVYDELNRPLYEEPECPYIPSQLTCQKEGRPDKGYQHWRWQPHGCSLRSFNATFMLERLRGKRMLFVGDSLNRGQYTSMVCLLQKVIPEHAKSMRIGNDSLTVFTAKEYNATIEFYWAPFLLESNFDNALDHRFPDGMVHNGSKKKKIMVRKNSIDKHGQHWKGADVLVFNTYLWWQGSFQDKDKVFEKLKTEDAYRVAINSLVKWVEKNTDPKKNRVMFTAMSPLHKNSSEWGEEPSGNCLNQTTLIEDPEYWGVGSNKSLMEVVKQEFSKSKVPITFINITQLSEYRKDAHVAIYKKQWNPLTKEQIANPTSYADCVHWCLPGLQDIWNELLYTKLFYPYQ